MRIPTPSMTSISRLSTIRERQSGGTAPLAAVDGAADLNSPQPAVCSEPNTDQHTTETTGVAVIAPFAQGICTKNTLECLNSTTGHVRIVPDAGSCARPEAGFPYCFDRMFPAFRERDSKWQTHHKCHSHERKTAPSQRNDGDEMLTFAPNHFSSNSNGQISSSPNAIATENGQKNGSSRALDIALDAIPRSRAGVSGKAFRRKSVGASPDDRNVPSMQRTDLSLEPGANAQNTQERRLRRARSAGDLLLGIGLGINVLADGPDSPTCAATGNIGDAGSSESKDSNVMRQSQGVDVSIAAASRVDGTGFTRLSRQDAIRELPATRNDGVANASRQPTTGRGKFLGRVLGRGHRMMRRSGNSLREQNPPQNL